MEVHIRIEHIHNLEGTHCRIVGNLECEHTLLS